jgi:hypothetical protein
MLSLGPSAAAPPHSTTLQLDADTDVFPTLEIDATAWEEAQQTLLRQRLQAILEKLLTPPPPTSSAAAEGDSREQQISTALQAVQAQLAEGAFGTATSFLRKVHASLSAWCETEEGASSAAVSAATAKFEQCRELVASTPEGLELVKAAARSGELYAGGGVQKENGAAELACAEGVEGWHRLTQESRLRWTLYRQMQSALPFAQQDALIRNPHGIPLTVHEHAASAEDASTSDLAKTHRDSVEFPPFGKTIAGTQTQTQAAEETPAQEPTGRQRVDAGSTEAQPADAKQEEAQPADAKQEEAQPADAKQEEADVKQEEAGTVEEEPAPVDAAQPAEADSGEQSQATKGKEEDSHDQKECGGDDDDDDDDDDDGGDDTAGQILGATKREADSESARSPAVRSHSSRDADGTSRKRKTRQAASAAAAASSAPPARATRSRR